MGVASSTPSEAPSTTPFEAPSTTPSTAPSNDDFLNCTNDYELAMKASKDLEYLLEHHFHAHGRGLHEKISTARGLTPDLERDMRYVATIRNKLIHQRGFDSIPDRQQFLERFVRLSVELQRRIEKRIRERSSGEVVFTSAPSPSYELMIMLATDAASVLFSIAAFFKPDLVYQDYSFKSRLMRMLPPHLQRTILEDNLNFSWEGAYEEESVYEYQDQIKFISNEYEDKDY